MSDESISDIMQSSVFSAEDFASIQWDHNIAGEVLTRYATHETEVKGEDGEDFDFDSIFRVATDESTRMPRIDKPITFQMPAGRREFRDMEANQFIGNCGTITQDLGKLMYHSNGRCCEIGVAKRKLNFALEVDGSKAFENADTYAEEVTGKGTGLGWSQFVHSAASLVLISVNKDATYEPHDGFDVVFNESEDLNTTASASTGRGVTVEVTGNNFRIRDTSAAWVISKYLLLSACCESSDIKSAMSFARAEEVFDTSMYSTTGWQQTSSPYTKSISEMHESFRVMTDAQLDSMSSYASRYFLELAPGKRPDLSVPNIEEHMERAQRDGGKAPHPGPCETDCSFKGPCRNLDRRYPTPFRVLPRKPAPVGDVARRERHEVTASWHPSENHSTFHNSPPNDYGRFVQISKKRETTYRIKEFGTLSEMLFAEISKTTIMQAIHLEKELLMRINGVRGFYYSQSANAGICWSARTRDALVFDIRYYTFEDPGDPSLVGIWARYGGVWKSPSFKINKSEIAHALTLPGKCAATWISVVNAMEGNVNKSVKDSVCHLFATWRDSCWETTRMASCSRFKTTGHLGESENLAAMLEKSWGDVKKMRSSTYMLYLLDRRALSEPPCSDLTPMFRFPLRLHCLEKDIAHGMSWHQRPANHETDCCLKMLKATSDEVERRPETLGFMCRQATFMKKCLEGSAGYREFKELCGSRPTWPVLNFPFFIGLSWIARNELSSISASQQNTNFSIKSLISDRGSLSVRSGVLSSGKVATNLTNLIKSYSSRSAVQGPYGLLLRSMEDNEIENIYTISAKDAKGGDREISTMNIKHRPRQAFSEAQSSTVANGMPESALLTPEKYSPMVRGFVRVANATRSSVMVSEDRSFFCGNLCPEFMSLTSAATARASGSLGMVSCSAIQRLNTHRTIVLPPEFDVSELPKNIESGFRLWRRGKSIHKVVSIKMYKHMMQGIEAINADTINAVVNAGIHQICVDALEENAIVDHYGITTSDDVGRANAFNPSLDRETLVELTILRPLRDEVLGQAMMLNNDKKLVVSSKKSIVEVNNITVTNSGMVSQIPIFMSLSVQPLNGIGPLQDLISVVSNSRAQLWWGAGPCEVWACFDANRDLFRERWRIRNHEMSYLHTIGMLPNTIEELIMGFHPRTDKAFNALWNANSEDNKAKVRSGERSLTTSLARKCAFAAEDAELDTFTPTGLLTYDRRVTEVLRSRMNGGRLKSHHTRQPKVSQLIAKKDKFFELLGNDSSGPSDDVIRSFDLPRVHCHYRPYTRRDHMPCRVGDTTELDVPESRSIMMIRAFGVPYRDLPTDEERRVAGLEACDFNTEMNRISRLSYYRGLEFTNPAGLPSVTFNASARYFNPQAFSFSIETSGSKRTKRGFTFRGVEVHEFKPCLWGGITIDNARGGLMAFGTGSLGGNKHAFYQRRRGGVRCKPIGSDRQGSFEVGSRMRCHYVVGVDLSPLSIVPTTELPAARGHLNGDPMSLVNYGGWFQTKSRDAMELMSKIYEDHESSMPNFIRDYLPDYPFWPRTPQVMGDSATYTLTGINKVRDTELTRGIQVPALADFTGDSPNVCYRLRVKVPEGHAEIVDW